MNPVISDLMVVPLVVLLMALSPGASAYPSGAPNSNGTCISMDPSVGHAKRIQYSPLPYKLSVVLDVHRDRGVRMTLSALGNHTFKGFMVQVRKDEKEDLRTYGRFSNAEPDLLDGSKAKTQFSNCLGLADSMATHTENSDKTQVSFDWEAPYSDSSYDVFTSVVHNLTTYWVKEKVARVKVVDGKVQLVDADCASGTRRGLGEPVGGLVVLVVAVLIATGLVM